VGLASGLLLAGLLVGCSPTHNWRSVGFEGAPVQALLPCKPEIAQREVPLAGPDQPPLKLQMLSCDVGSLTFAVSAVRLPDAGLTKAVQANWRRAAWASLKQAVPPDAQVPVGWSTQPVRLLGGVEAQHWSGPGLNHRQQTIQAHLQWQEEAGWLVQAAVYGPAADIDSTLLDSFMSGLKLR
jgi:hypothetical protein